MEKILAFIDLLGFSQMVERDPEKARTVLNDFYNISYQIIKDNTDVNGSLFSDSLLAHSNNFAALINCITEIYRRCLNNNTKYLEDEHFFLLPRGAISVGYFNIEERSTSPNLTKDFIVSPALVHSAKLEQSIKGSRLLVAVKKDDSHQISDLLWNNNIKSILYENSAFEFWKNYTYSDSLWFLNLNKSPIEQNKEVVSLIDISIALVNKNASNNKILDQHINTLRIGLLSYIKFVRTIDDPYITRIINEFSDDKYWLLWLTIIEVIVNSGDHWQYVSSRFITDFIKRSIVKTGWAKVLEEINKPGHKYMLDIFNSFFQEMNISTIS
ncbi:hypothetical protein [Larkinella humicola]|uniref:Guanylate cyclase domain-containing protein n=1 Tax=Larkinella humicola TaxID=2607654 RepID=A0A5N1J3P7_9BACT|nr:hypothetical protein [Larkinella humicola]KAA9341156.1 hypothetical protein F0P93_30440 [Larkinella humicola]